MLLRTIGPGATCQVSSVATICRVPSANSISNWAIARGRPTGRFFRRFRKPHIFIGKGLYQPLPSMSPRQFRPWTICGVTS